MTPGTEPALDFARRGRRTRELPLIPMIDVVFILIIFFMLTTSFMKIESMELLLPTSASAKKVADTSIAHIILYNDGRMGFGQRVVDASEMKRTLSALFARNPEQRVVVLTEDKVSLQSLVQTMNTVYLAGGKSVYVKAWQEPPPAPARAGDDAQEGEAP